MIFVTVGSQLPFDRLVASVDRWAFEHPSSEVFGQVGDSPRPPEHFASVSTMSPEDYRTRFEAADLVVGHAGMGTIIAALELGKPLLMLPRLGSLQESRNDNQVGTARHFRSLARFEAADSESEIPARIDYMLAHLDDYRIASVEFGVKDTLVRAIRDFVCA